MNDRTRTAKPNGSDFAALIYPGRVGPGGLGLQAATAAAGLALAGPLIALGPGRDRDWVLETPPPDGVIWNDLPSYRTGWLTRRLRPGRDVFARDRHLGRSAAATLDQIRPGLVYAFVQVGLEALEWARACGVPTVLDNPNGHIQGFARVYRDEWGRWVGGRYHGHPTSKMIDRVEREYELADRIRVSSDWAKQSMVRHGVPEGKVFVCPQPVNRVRFGPPADRLPLDGPLRIVYVGSLDLRKGFVYLLKAARAVGSTRVRLELVGGTGDRGAKALLARERAGLEVIVSPGDPVPAYHRAELFVLPSLEDGFGFVTAEAMACGLPVVVTDQCGSAGWVRPGESGWIIPSGDVTALVRTLENALANRSDLVAMGKAARRSIVARDPGDPLRCLAEWVYLRPLSPLTER